MNSMNLSTNVSDEKNTTTHDFNEVPEALCSFKA